MDLKTVADGSPYAPPRALRLSSVSGAAGNGWCEPGSGDLACDTGYSAYDICDSNGSNAVNACSADGNDFDI